MSDYIGLPLLLLLLAVIWGAGDRLFSRDERRRRERNPRSTSRSYPSYWD